MTSKLKRIMNEDGSATAEYAIATIVSMVRCSRVDKHIAATVAESMSTRIENLNDQNWNYSINEIDFTM